MNKIILSLVLALIVALPSYAVTVTDILETVDKLQKLDEDITAKVSIVRKDVEQGTKLMEAVYYAKDADDLFLIVMTKPESEKGNGYLKSGKNFWMYRRNTRTFQHISRDESIAGTDANAGDFEAPKYVECYESVKDSNGKEVIKEKMLGKIPVYEIEITATVPDVDYPQKKMWVRCDNYLPLKEQGFSLSGSLMYTQYFLKYTKVDKKFIAKKQLVVDEFEKGNRTLWEIEDISFSPVEDTVFTKAYLENLSK